MVSQPKTQGLQDWPTRVWGDWQLDLDADDVVRAEAGDPARLRARHSPAAEVAANAISVGVPLITPRVAWRRLAVLSLRHHTLYVGRPPGRLTGAPIVERLAGACEVVVFVCTIGPQLEDKVSSVFAEDPALAVALDALGSAAVQNLSSLARARIEAQAAARGWAATPPVSPGEPQWPVDVGQAQVFALVRTSLIGVSLTSAGMMRPQKSASAVIGQGPDISALDWDVCEHCSMAEVCRYRQARKKPAQEAGNTGHSFE
jgi:hypothetical protein